MNTLTPSRIRELLKQHGTQIVVPLILLILSVMSYCICGKPAASELLLPEWGTRYLLPAVALLSTGLAALRRFYASLALFIGYHTGLALAVLGTDAGAEHLLYGQITLLATLVIFLAVGVWAEIFSILLPRWRAERKTAS